MSGDIAKCPLEAKPPRVNSTGSMSCAVPTRNVDVNSSFEEQSVQNEGVSLCRQETVTGVLREGYSCLGNGTNYFMTLEKSFTFSESVPFFVKQDGWILLALKFNSILDISIYQH